MPGSAFGPLVGPSHGAVGAAAFSTIDFAEATSSTLAAEAMPGGVGAARAALIKKKRLLARMRFPFSSAG